MAMTTEEMQVLVSMIRSELQGDMRGLRDELKGDMRDLRDELKGEIRETRVLVEQQRHDIQLLAEKVELINDKLGSVNRMEEQLADHDTRIFALEVVTRALKAQAQ